MPETSEKQLSEVVFSWRHPEYIRYRKNIWWYVISLIVLILLSIWAIAQGNWFGDQNYLFVVFLVLFYLVVLIYEFRQPEEVDFIITPDGVKSGRRFYYYKDIDNFFVIYQEQGIKNLYLDFVNPLRGRLVVPLDGQDAVAIREFLLGFLKEDLDREVEPLSERFRRWLKL
ncbi:MAG: hypothetical protein WC518_00285 [Patescibacteria group bacterium]